MTITFAVPVEKEKPIFKAKDPMSALTHFIGFLAAIIAFPILMMKGVYNGHTASELFSLGVFALSMILLYGASTAYHSFNLDTDNKNLKLKKLDHTMIAVLVAGTYTPLCVMPLKGIGGTAVLITLWALAAIAIVLKLVWVTCPKWLSSAVYLLMGWLCLPLLPMLHSVFSAYAFHHLLLGGILYSIGAVIYAVKFPLLEKKHWGFGSHEVFHLFVMGGTLMHFLMVYSLI